MDLQNSFQNIEDMPIDTWHANVRHAGIGEKDLINLSQTIDNNVCQSLSTLCHRCIELEEKAKRGFSISPDEIQGIHNLGISANETLHEVTQAILNNSDDKISDRDIIISICNDIDKLFGVSVKFTCHDQCLPPKDKNREHVIRFIQEALSNAARHSGKFTVNFRIDTNQDYYTYIISDKGGGFDVNSPTKGLGLELMKFNADVLSAEFTIHSNQKGTVVFLKLPR